MNCKNSRPGGLNRVILLLVWLLVGTDSMIAGTYSRHSRAPGHSRPHVIHKAGWAGAGLAAGRVAGPAGSAVVGAAKYRHDLKAGGHRRKRAIVKIGAPIGAGIVAGPAGTVGYEAYDHRHWIKRHILRQGAH